jgi:membrane-associated phospholipid phosphatase
MLRVLASTLVALSLAVPAYAQESVPAPEGAIAAAAPAGTEDPQQLPPTGLTLPKLPAGEAPKMPIESPIGGNPFKLAAGDFKNFFGKETAQTLAYTSIVAIAAAPWDREGVNNGFNLPTPVFQGGNVIGNFVFQIGAGFATYAGGKAVGNKKLAYAGRDIVRAQFLSQGIVQALKYTVQRERPDGSDNKSFPSGHSASMFATATVLQKYYGWKVGVPAYAMGSYVALARMAWNRHHATDVVMGAGFGIASAHTVTMTMNKTKFAVGVQPQVGGASINFTMVPKK